MWCAAAQAFNNAFMGRVAVKNTLVLFGAGHMGSAIARGMLRSGNTDLRIIDPDFSKLQEFRALGIRTDTACLNLAPNDVLMLAMPPQVFGAFSSDSPCVHDHRGLVISVMAGIRISSIQQMLSTPNVVRSIPNTPSEVFEGMTVYCRSSSVDENLTRMARDVLESFGQAVEVRDEALIDPATALCGGGPAFVAYFAAALQDFGIKAGIPKDAALAITIQLLRGTSELLAITGKPAMQLCREVMTPDGTTERGIWHFDEQGLSATVLDALTKSSARSSQLGLVITESLSQFEVAK
jgi:pyrroline-5-carboxylate reductase